MSNGFIYVVDAHFIDKIEEKKSWTQVPVVNSYNPLPLYIYLYLQFCTKIYRLHSVLSKTNVEMKPGFS